jgi:hypothetical protein
MSIDDRLRRAARAANDSVQELPTADLLIDLTRRRRRYQTVRVAVPFAMLLALVVVFLVVRPIGVEPGTGPGAGVTADSTWGLSPRPGGGTPPAPPTDVVMHEVWRGGAEAHPHGVTQGQWAMTQFRVTEPFLRSVEVNVGGPSTVRLVVYRHTGSNQWTQVVARTVPVQQDGHTKAVFAPAIAVDVGETLYLQVLNVEQEPLAVYFSDRDDAPSTSSYLWCQGPAATCVHPGHDMNAIVYGWARAS